MGGCDFRVHVIFVGHAFKEIVVVFTSVVAFYGVFCGCD